MAATPGTHENFFNFLFHSNPMAKVWGGLAARALKESCLGKRRGLVSAVDHTLASVVVGHLDFQDGGDARNSRELFQFSLP